MCMRSKFIQILIILSLFLTLQLSAAEISFEKDVWPILESRCIKCHGPDKIEKGKVKHAKADLRLDSVKAIQKGGDSGLVVLPGNAAKSLLYQLTDPDEDDVMPPKGKPLSTKERQTLKAFIK